MKNIIFKRFLAVLIVIVLMPRVLFYADYAKAAGNGYRVLLDVPGYSQRDLGFPTGCELVALLMMLNYELKDDMDINDLAAKMPYANDPNKGFRGDPKSSGGFTVFPPALLALVEEMLGCAPLDMSGCTMEELQRQLDRKTPVAVWVVGLGWNVHCVTLTGYNEEGFFYNDPWTGAKNEHINFNAFYGIWNTPIYDKLYGRNCYPTRKALSYEKAPIAIIAPMQPVHRIDSSIYEAITDEQTAIEAVFFFAGSIGGDEKANSDTIDHVIRMVEYAAAYAAPIHHDGSELRLDATHLAEYETEIARRLEILTAALNDQGITPNRRVERILIIKMPEGAAAIQIEPFKDAGMDRVIVEIGSELALIFKKDKINETVMLTIFEDNTNTILLEKPLAGSSVTVAMKQMPDINSANQTIVNAHGVNMGGYDNPHTMKLETSIKNTETLRVEEVHSTFGDIGNLDEAIQEAVIFLKNRGRLRGKTSELFDPYAEVTRAEFCTMLYNAFEDKTPGHTPLYFHDVDEDAWYYEGVKALSEKGYLSGYPDGTFRPHEKMTRQEVIAAAGRILRENKGYSSANKQFAANYFNDSHNIAD